MVTDGCQEPQQHQNVPKAPLVSAEAPSHHPSGERGGSLDTVGQGLGTAWPLGNAQPCVRPSSSLPSTQLAVNDHF